MTLDEMLSDYRDMFIELAPHIDALENLKRLIVTHVKETGETGNTEGVTVKIRNGYERVSWDGKALAGYAAAHPEIETFKSVSAVGPSVTIAVK